ncbi:MAG: hypothetical protein C0601_09220 [Candidatus Muiribacterium halophilum]|uniref:Radical SAM core domain-containing protein n=1 Tax=Muiribacterium halophilum TaxID=2053465 RepID=A0A2N5ZDR8_MUIH1|nr:MAG: hypothetical protein C0601_09220 [Candidatus Muirbacterium halophilum]
MKKNNNFFLIKTHLFKLIRLFLAFLLKKEYRFALSVRLTDRCQLSCVYCRKKHIKYDIDLDILIKFLKIFRKKGGFYVILTGGEPFLYPHIEKLVRFLKENKFYVAMNTNGQAIENPKYRNILKEMDEIVVSLDGPEKENDKNRGSGTYKKIIKTIKYLYKNNKKIVLSTVLTRNNLKSSTLEFFIKIKKRYGLIVDFGVVSPYIFGSVNKEMVLEETKQKSFIKKILEFKQKYSIKELSKQILDYQKKPYKIRCIAPKYTIYVDVDGCVYPCIYGIGKPNMILGNIKNKDEFCYKNIYCDVCYCQSLLALNLFSQKKNSIISFLRWIV